MSPGSCQSVSEYHVVDAPFECSVASILQLINILRCYPRVFCVTALSFFAWNVLIVNWFGLVCFWFNQFRHTLNLQCDVLWRCKAYDYQQPVVDCTVVWSNRRSPNEQCGKAMLDISYVFFWPVRNMFQRRYVCFSCVATVVSNADERFWSFSNCFCLCVGGETVRMQGALWNIAQILEHATCNN